MSVSNEQLEARRERVANLRREVASAEAQKQLNLAAQENDIMDKQLAIEETRLQAQLEAAKASATAASQQDTVQDKQINQQLEAAKQAASQQSSSAQNDSNNQRTPDQSGRNAGGVS